MRRAIPCLLLAFALVAGCSKQGGGPGGPGGMGGMPPSAVETVVVHSVDAPNTFETVSFGLTEALIVTETLPAAAPSELTETVTK